MSASPSFSPDSHFPDPYLTSAQKFTFCTPALATDTARSTATVVADAVTDAADPMVRVSSGHVRASSHCLHPRTRPPEPRLPRAPFRTQTRVRVPNAKARAQSPTR